MMGTCVLPLVLLFIAFTSSTIAQKTEAPAVPAGTEVVVAAGAPISLECELRVEQRAAWLVQRADGGAWLEPADDLRAGGERALGGGGARLAARLQAPRARAAHAGLYRCHPAAAPVRLTVLPAPASAVAVAPAAAPSAAPPADADEKARELVWYELGKQLQLTCTVDGEVTYLWSKNGSALEPRPELLSADGGVLTIAKAHEDDFGNYSCRVGSETRAAWDVRARPLARLPANSHAVEGQAFSITCKLHGKPAPRVRWLYAPPGTDPLSGNGSLVATEGEGEGAGARFRTLDSPAGVPGGVLTAAAAERADAGVYWCAPPEGARAATILRVKDAYAALWPFLGICLEVFILCAIILVYEKRRTKPEMDDSDADAHDQ